MKRTFEFGKIDYYNHGRKTNRVAVDVELKTKGGTVTFGEAGEVIGMTPPYVELSIVGKIYSPSGNGFCAGGQCLDLIAAHVNELNDVQLFKTIYKFWQKYHMNSLHSGTPEQEQAIKIWEAAGNQYDYELACEMLKDVGLYEVEFTGITVGKRYNNELYRYGSGWVVYEIPGDILLTIEHMINAAPTAG